MPNWCENDLWVAGPEFMKVVDFVASKPTDGTPPDAFDFNQSIEMPACLQETHSGPSYSRGCFILGGPASGFLRDLDEPRTTDLSVLRAFYAKRYPKDTVEAQANYKAWLETGYLSWYEWANSNWGTKWNACDSQVQFYRGFVKFKFNTAWGPPNPVIATLAAKFPQNKLTHKYYECGMAVKGSDVYEKGVLVSSTTQEYHGSRGG